MFLLSLAALLLPTAVAQLPFSLSVSEIPHGMESVKFPDEGSSKSASTSPEEDRISGRRLGELIHDVSKELYLTFNNPYYYQRRITGYPILSSQIRPSVYSNPYANPYSNFPSYPTFAGHEGLGPVSPFYPDPYLAAQPPLRNPWTSQIQSPTPFGVYPF